VSGMNHIKIAIGQDNPSPRLAMHRQLATSRNRQG
jgi:hypothetical protein